MIAYFMRFSLSMTKEQALSASHSGACDDDVKTLSFNPKICRQLEKIGDDDISAELKEYGAWDDEELSDKLDNELRIIWIAACDIAENLKKRS